MRGVLMIFPSRNNSEMWMKKLRRTDLAPDHVLDDPLRGLGVEALAAAGGELGQRRFVDEAGREGHDYGSKDQT